ARARGIGARRRRGARATRVRAALEDAEHDLVRRQTSRRDTHARPLALSGPVVPILCTRAPYHQRRPRSTRAANLATWELTGGGRAETPRRSSAAARPAEPRSGRDDRLPRRRSRSSPFARPAQRARRWTARGLERS